MTQNKEVIHLPKAIGVEDTLWKQKMDEQNSHYMELIIGVLLCTFAFIPFFLGWNTLHGDWFLLVAGTWMMFSFGLGMAFIMHAAVIRNAYSLLLDENYFSRRKQKGNPQYGFYWMFVAFFYAGLSVFTGYWAWTWLIWPIAFIGLIIYARYIKK